MLKQQQTRSSTGGSDLSTRITDSMRKKFCMRQFFFGLYHVARIALAITIIVLISSTDLVKIKQKSQYQRVQQIVQIWQKDVIIDMITVSTYNCPKGYEEYSAAQWIGTKQGCYCTTELNQYVYENVLPGQCSLKSINVGCTRIDPQKSIPFVFWKTQKLICVKRIIGLNFFTNISNSIKPSQIKTCSLNTPYQFQSLKAQPCPITQISNQSSTFPHILPQIDYSYDRQSSYPIVDIKISQYSFCQQYNRSNISPHRFQNYILQVIQISNCEEDNDPRVKVVDQVTEKQLFKNNKRINDIISTALPVYPIPNQMYSYKLGTVEYPPWSQSCRQSEQFNLKTTKNIFEFDQFIQKSQSCIYLTIVMLIIWGFLYSLGCIIKHIFQIHSRHQKGILFYPDSQVLRSYPNLMPHQLRLSLFCQIIILTIMLLIALGMLIQIGLQYQTISKTQEWFRNSFACMDGNGRGYFQKWVSQGYCAFLQVIIRMYLICILAGLVIVCIDIIYFIWRVNKGDLQDQTISIAQILGRNSERNSDEQLSDRKNQQGDQKDHNDIVIQDIDMDQKYQQNDDSFNKNLDRQKTGDIDLKQFHVNDQEVSQVQDYQRMKKRTQTPMSIKMSRNSPSPVKGASALGKTRGPTYKVNETEQSFQNIEDDDIQFVQQPFTKTNSINQKKSNAGSSKNNRNSALISSKNRSRTKMQNMEFQD